MDKCLLVLLMRLHLQLVLLFDWTDKITISPSYNFNKQFINYTNYTIDKTNFTPTK